ncbi:MAG: M16 family metallopeptidase [Planctomycetota bacterium]|jgi:predicted Zn-dependent peptidase
MKQAMQKVSIILMGEVSIILMGVGILHFAMATLTPELAQAQELAEFEKRMTKFTLGNGLKFLVLERHEAPVVSFHIYADVGCSDEVKGITGLAHLFEHMAFKGSKTIGTKNYKAEVKAMAKMDAAFAELKAEQRKGDRADKARLEKLQEQFEQAQQEAQEYLVHDEFEEAYVREGSAGFNARTGYDSTRYVVSLPSNKIELWMSLESDRFLNPVLREFYKERDVVMEERRLRTESNPQGKLVEEFLAIAYKAHPYGEPIVGHMSDLKTLTRAEAEAFFKKYYSPSNLTIAIVGDVNPDRIRGLAEKYFGRIPSSPKPDPVETVEPPQVGERRVAVEDRAQPIFVVGYHKPGFNDPKNAVFDAITDIMGIGRTSRLYKSLVKEKKIAIAASGFQGWPGNKYPSLFWFYAVPARGHTNQECEQAIYAEIERLKTEPVLPEELEKAKTRSRASLIRGLASNEGLAAEITFYEVISGDWRNMFKQLEKIDQVTAEDIQRVARQYFTTANRTVGVIETITIED